MNDTHEKQPSGNEDSQSDYQAQLEKWRNNNDTSPPSERSSLQDALEPIKQDFFEGIKRIRPFPFLAFLGFLVPEYFVWGIHFERWQEASDFEPSRMKLNAVLAFGIVAGMALFWHLVITCWQSKCQTGQIGRGLLLFTVMVFLVFAGLFLTECMAFYESLSKSGTDPFGNVISGKSHREALITIGSWVSVNFLIGFITGFCAYHITRKE